MNSWAILIIALFLATQTAFASGSGVRGGGEPDKVKVATIRWLLENGDLKKSLIGYVNGIDLDSLHGSTMDRQVVKVVLTRILKNMDLQKDIISSPYVVSSSCHDYYAKEVPASAGIGDLGGKICFNIEELSREYKDLSVQDMFLNLSVLTLHEHIHHFQPPSAGEKLNEREAYLVAGYVRTSAYFPKVPDIAWSSPERVCPWVHACDWRMKRGVHVRGCGGTFTMGYMGPYKGREIVMHICGNDPQCIASSMKDAPTILETIQGRNFSVTGLFCANNTWEDGRKEVQLFDPGSITLKKSTYPIVGKFTYSINKTLMSFTPGPELQTLSFQAGPNSLDSRVLCDYDERIQGELGFGIRFHENGFIESCITKNFLITTKLGKFKSYETAFYDDGTVHTMDAVGEFTAIIKGKKYFLHGHPIEFHKNGLLRRAIARMNEDDYIHVCFDSEGNLIKTGDWAIQCGETLP